MDELQWQFPQIYDVDQKTHRLFSVYDLLFDTTMVEQKTDIVREVFIKMVKKIVSKKVKHEITLAENSGGNGHHFLPALFSSSYYEEGGHAPKRRKLDASMVNEIKKRVNQPFGRWLMDLTDSYGNTLVHKHVIGYRGLIGNCLQALQIENEAKRIKKMNKCIDLLNFLMSHGGAKHIYTKNHEGVRPMDTIAKKAILISVCNQGQKLFLKRLLEKFKIDYQK